jgi:hypothetical protein
MITIETGTGTGTATTETGTGTGIGVEDTGVEPTLLHISCFLSKITRANMFFVWLTSRRYTRFPSTFAKQMIHLPPSLLPSCLLSGRSRSRSEERKKSRRSDGKSEEANDPTPLKMTFSIGGSVCIPRFVSFPMTMKRASSVLEIEI